MNPSPADRSAIEAYIQLELALFPKASLQDLYKNYFQDAFGPGHLIPDKVKPAQYLLQELHEPHLFKGPLLQPLGIRHQFWRVNLSLVKNGIVPLPAMLEGLYLSAPKARNPQSENWIAEWQGIEEQIRELLPDLAHLEEDASRIRQTLAEGKFVMHHSSLFHTTYHPHYRIIHDDIVREWKLRFRLD
ncbi:MAG: hypothetical protein LWW85_10675 [Marinilabiliales bacterium]|nr:hypothetical protein [Marinilabiliales bacterium]